MICVLAKVTEGQINLGNENKIAFVYEFALAENKEFLAATIQLVSATRLSDYMVGEKYDFFSTREKEKE